MNWTQYRQIGTFRAADIKVSKKMTPNDKTNKASKRSFDEASALAASEDVTEAGLTGIDLAKFRCLRNAAYHDDRERHYSSFHKAMMFVVVLFGMLAFGLEMSAERGHLAPVATLVATVAGVIDLVFDLDGRARLHVSLKRRFYDLLARLDKGEDFTRIEEEITRNYPDEPPTMHAVNRIAFNSAIEALGRPAGQKFVLKPWQIIVRHWWPFEARSFPTNNEISRA